VAGDTAHGLFAKRDEYLSFLQIKHIDRSGGNVMIHKLAGRHLALTELNVLQESNLYY